MVDTQQSFGNGPRGLPELGESPLSPRGGKSGTAGIGAVVVVSFRVGQFDPCLMSSVPGPGVGARLLPGLASWRRRQ